MCALPSITRNDAALARAMQESSDAALARELSQQGQPPPRQPPPRQPGGAHGANCPRGCGLRRFAATAAQRIVCDRCGNRVPPGETAMSCLRCDFDLCARCAAGGPTGTGGPTGSPAPRRPQYVDPFARSAGVDAGMALVACTLGNARVEMMVDTGAQHSVISAPLARALGILDRLDTSEQGVAAGVGRARIIGKLRGVALTLDKGVEFALDFSCLEVQDQLLLLGLDQMRRFKCIVDLEREALVFGGAGGVRVPFLPREAQARHRARLEDSLPPELGCRPM